MARTGWVEHGRDVDGEESVTALRSVPEMLALEPAGTDAFRSVHPSRSSTWFFGGEVAGQAFMAAALTCPDDRRAHVANFQFLRAGDATLRTDYRVTRVRDGGSYTSRAVEAWQGDELLLTASVSFHAEESGSLRHGWGGDASERVGLPAAHELYVGDDEFERWRAGVSAERGVEYLFEGPPVRVAGARGESVPASQRAWHRISAVGGDDLRLNEAALVYVSDCLFLSVALGPHGITYGTPGLQFATLNHSVWFHAPIRVGEWFCYDQRSPWAGGGRGLCRGEMYDERGVLLATTMQEGLLRLRGEARR
ncbi:acyl-CoA thioesterase [Nocardioides sp. Iso805N]|uniref:acyl-CoA thioesterase n=1 Tax=Nocardioides sp. Iso805N TaxID=1283287 RepID=UPI0012FA9419|nr:acyl-CoA thioesterase domain-containing protein [Nocardioides sp. Iso805N]